MINRLIKAWLGDFKEGELKKFGLLSTIFLLVIGVYWLLRPLKDDIFQDIVGAEYTPKAKFLSLAVVLPLVLFYSKLVSMFERQKLFYALCSIYAVLAVVFAGFLMSAKYGLPNTEASPYRVLGWLWYVFVESYGSLMVALFWAFTADITKKGSAVDGFRLVSIGGQAGNMLGPLLGLAVSTYFIKSPSFDLGKGAVIGGIICFAALAILCIAFLVRFFMAVMPKEQLEGYTAKSEEGAPKKKKKAGFLEGLKLLLTQPYLLGIFSSVLFYEAIVTIIDFNFKLKVAGAFSGLDKSNYLFTYAIATGVTSFICATLGISRIQKVLGVGKSLALLPLVIAIVVFTFKTYPQLSVLFWLMVLAKAINYALNKPTEKQLYIPTSKDAKYTSQAFIDTYGSRGSKAAGSLPNLSFEHFKTTYGASLGATKFINVCSYISFAIIAAWLPLALWLGNTYNKAIKNDELVC